MAKEFIWADGFFSRKTSGNGATAKKKKLEELKSRFKECERCPLAKQGRNKIVFGYGNPATGLMLIGEGPGRDEDLAGKPFVGRAGKLLDKTLKSIGIDREVLYITNIVKCRPPGNRTPTQEESTTCGRLILDNEIRIISPKLVIALGATAARYFISDFRSMGSILGHEIDVTHNDTRFTLIPNYHPAYVLRNPRAYKVFRSVLENLLRYK